METSWECHVNENYSFIHEDITFTKSLIKGLIIFLRKNFLIAGLYTISCRERHTKIRPGIGMQI